MKFAMPDGNECLFQCEHCTMRFSSRASRAAHQSTVHGIRSNLSVASGSACLVCGTEWWTTFRPRRSPTCLSCYQNARRPLRPQVASLNVPGVRRRPCTDLCPGGPTCDPRHSQLFLPSHVLFMLRSPEMRRDCSSWLRVSLTGSLPPSVGSRATAGKPLGFPVSMLCRGLCRFCTASRSERDRYRC